MPRKSGATTGASVNMIKALGVIPARYASTRYPGKPLIEIAGKSMIQRVYEQAYKSLLCKTIVATDDERIFNHVKSFGGEVLMTSVNHHSGTDRCAEVLEKINEEYDVVVNIQGDEPFINPDDINSVFALFSDSETDIATLYKKITDVEDIVNPNVVKVVMATSGKALLFSRSTIPFSRTISINEAAYEGIYKRHIGLYAYRTEVLRKISLLESSMLERMESLEQLRWLENGFAIYAVEIFSDSYAIDTPADKEKIEQLFREGKLI